MSRRKIPGAWSARKDGSQSWRLPYRDPETGQQRSKLFATKGAAEDFFVDLQVGKRDRTWVRPDAGQERFDDFATTWAASQDWAPSTRESFGAHQRRLARYLNDARLDAIDKLTLQRLRTSLVADFSVSTATISLHYATAIMRDAFTTGRIPRDVTVGVKPPVRRGDDAGDRVGPDDVPTRDQVLSILTASQSQYRAVVVLGACGLRISEAIGVTAEQLDLERRLLVVDRQLVRINARPTFKKPKREKVRTVELPSWAVLELRRHLRDHGPFWPMDGQADSLLFRGDRDAPLRRDAFYVSAWRPALVAAGLTADAFVFHSLRHWCASMMLSKGAPITAVAGHLGDVPETVLRTYAHWLRDERSLPAALLDEAFRDVASERVVTRS
jgi:integrase